MSGIRKNIKVLILGGGQIGSYTTLYLKDKYSVYVADLKNNKLFSFLNPEIKLICNIDILDEDCVQKLFRTIQPDVVIHSVGISKKITDTNPNLYKKNNLRGLKNVIKEALENKVSRFVYISSFSVYGMQNIEMLNEYSDLLPNSKYGKIKRATEKEVLKVRDKIKITIVRPCGVYGLRITCNGLGSSSSLLIEQIIQTKINRVNEPQILNASFADEYIYAKDLGRAIYSIISLKKMPKIINVGSGKITKLKELCEIGGMITGQEYTPNIKDFDVLPPLDISLLKKNVYFSHTYDLETGIIDYLSDFQKFQNHE